MDARACLIFAAALALSACDLGEFAGGVSRALIEGERYVVQDDEVVWVSHPGMGARPGGSSAGWTPTAAPS